LSILDKILNRNTGQSIPNKKFITALCNTIRWTEQIVRSFADKPVYNYGTALRQGSPIYKGKPFYTYEMENYAKPPRVPFNYHKVLKAALYERNIEPLQLSNIDSLGKILLFETDLTTYDGIAIVESLGFVDFADIPPIDTWFYVTDELLYCWIPALFIEKMNAAMAVEVYDSYKWLNETNPALNSRIIMEAEHQLQ
jgi:hypothetical protein